MKSNPSCAFQVHTATDCNFYFKDNGQTPAYPSLQAFTDSGAWTHLEFIASAFYFGGNVGIGNTNPSYSLQIANDSAAKPTTNTWTVISDSRVKRNIKDLVGGLDIIKRLRPVEAEYNGLLDLPEGERILSFLAEEIREILPGTVKSHRGKLREADTEETDILDFNIHEVLIHLVLAVKQLAAMVPGA
jgi:hypothetical protein